jgi:anti-sigma regulatory factor (Ser/Thr protein kinase)
MGQLRNALRAFAFEHADPAEAVRRLNRLVDGLADAPFATLAYVVVDPRNNSAQYVVAGHPPPLVRSPDGTVVFLEGGRSLPLGVDADVAVSAGEIVLEPGSTLVLYTDGLIERRDRPLDVGLEQLRLAVERCGGDAEEVVDAVLAEMFATDERGDDVAVVALRLEDVAAENLDLALPSDSKGLVQMRTELRDWLERVGVPSADAEEIVLAAWEAGANAIEHAQGPTERLFRVEGSLAPAGRLRLEVRDTGRWKPSNGADDRGLGLTLMRSLMDRVDVVQGDTGTLVVLERHVGSGGEV